MRRSRAQRTSNEETEGQRAVLENRQLLLPRLRFLYERQKERFTVKISPVFMKGVGKIAARVSF